MAYEVVDGPDLSAVHVTTIQPSQVQRVKLYAPNNVTGTDPGPWEPLDSSSPSEVLSTFSTTLYKDYNTPDTTFIPDGDATDALIGSQVTWDNDTEYTGVESYCRYGVNDIAYYVERPVMTYDITMIGAGSGTAPVGSRGSEARVTGSATISSSVNLTGSLYSSSLTDPVYHAHVDNAVLHYVIVPESMLTKNNDDNGHGGEWGWTEWPTKAVLQSLTPWKSYRVSDMQLGTPTSFSGQIWQSVTITDTWMFDTQLVNGRVHVAGWFEWGTGATTPNPLYDNEFTITSLNFDTAARYPTNNDITGVYVIDTLMSSFDGVFASQSGSVYLRVGSASANPVIVYGWGGVLISPGSVYEFTWSSIENNNFGVAFTVVPWGGGFVVRPNDVYGYYSTSSSVVATHSSAFVTGDVCGIDFNPTTRQLKVYKNGSLVTNVVVPASPSADYYQYASLWFGEANANNRIGGVITSKTIPTRRGILDFNVDQDDDVFTVTGGIERRYMYPVGYPVPRLERWHSTTDTPVYTIWTKLDLDACGDQAEVFIGWTNTEAGVLAANNLNREQMPPYAEVVVRPHDGKVVMSENIGTSWRYSYDESGWITLPSGRVRTTGADPVRQYDYGTPWDQFMWTKGFDVYLRLRYPASSADYYNWQLPVSDLTFFAHPRPKNLPARVWHWVDGDDHNGLQNRGYAHNVEVVDRPLNRDVTIDEGVAFVLESAYEDYIYASSFPVFGYTEELGPFFYGHTLPGDQLWENFSDNAVVNWNGVGTADAQGRHFGALEYSATWSGARDPGDPTNLYLSVYANDGYDAVSQLSANRKAPIDLGAQQDPWPSVYNRAAYGYGTVVRLWCSGLYPDSVFCLFEHRASGGLVHTMAELHVQTGDVVRLMDPPLSPYEDPSSSSASYRAQWIVSEDGSHLIGSITNTNAYERSYATYDLATGVIDSITLVGDLSVGYNVEAAGPVAGDKVALRINSSDTSVLIIGPDGFNSLIELESYQGKAFNDGGISVTGRYVWNTFLNYHIDGLNVWVGDQQWPVHNGHGNLFMEVVRWDLEAPSAATMRRYKPGRVKVWAYYYSSDVYYEWVDGTVLASDGTVTIDGDVNAGPGTTFTVNFEYPDYFPYYSRIVVQQFHPDGEAFGVTTLVDDFLYLPHTGAIGTYTWPTTAASQSVPGRAPIEYVFNLDTDPDGAGIFVDLDPVYGYPKRNYVSENQWSPQTTDGFSVSNGGSMSVPAQGSIRFAPNGTNGAIFNVDSILITIPNAYYASNFQAMFVGDPNSVSGYVRVDIIVIDASTEAFLYSGTYQYLYPSSYSSWADVNLYPFYTGYSGSNVKLRFTFASYLSGGAFDFRKFGVYHDYSYAAGFVDPALANQYALTGYQKASAGDRYYLGQTAYSAAFSPGSGVVIGHNFTAGLRKPPSQRNPEFARSRQNRAITSMIPGSMNGRVANAAPAGSSSVISTGSGGSGSVDSPREFTLNFYGELTTGDVSSPMRVTDAAFTTAAVYGTLGTPGSGSTVVTIKSGSSTISTLSFGSGVSLKSAAVVVKLPVDAIITATVTTAGFGASDLTVQVRT